MIYNSVKLISPNISDGMADGSLSGGINRQGVNYYNNLINELLSKGMHALVSFP